LNCFKEYKTYASAYSQFSIEKLIISQKPNALARIEKAMIGINQQKKVMMKQRLTSSVSIFLTSPYLTIKIIPRAAMPTTTIDHPRISHLKNSANEHPNYQLAMVNEQ